MTVFLVVAALLALVAVALVVVPLALPRAANAPPAPWLALLSALVVAGGSALLYPAFSNWSWSKSAATAAAPSPNEMVGQLARRLEKQPEDLQGWLLLGRSYAAIAQYPLAVRAFERADRLAGSRNAEALSGMAEALIMGGLSDLDSRAGRLFEQALALEPTSTKLMFYSAIAALERGENPLARARFATLLAANPPAEVRTLIEKQIQALDAGSASPPPAAPAQPATAGAAAQPVATINLHITLSPKVAASAASGAPLFVLARSPGQRGPPLAAKRLDARFPQDVQLSSTDAMIAGSGFVAGQDLEVTARISNGGSAIATPGDPVGTVRHRVGDAGTVNIVIGELTP